MPGDLKSIGCLDLQFGALDIMSDNTYDNTDSKFGTVNNTTMDTTITTTNNSSIDLNTSVQNSSLDSYSPSKPNTQCSISTVLTQSVS